MALPVNPKKRISRIIDQLAKILTDLENIYENMDDSKPARRIKKKSARKGKRKK